MATQRRLCDSDVRSIFESLHHNRPPPPNLKFQIVAVNSNGLKLSPPSYEFEDGLYVLLKAQKKGQHFPDYSKVPKHLMGLITEKYSVENCPWSLSGPQFPHPTAIQQRYCYPKGNEPYSSTKGGALWTMYGTDGKEDHEFRLLHVYYSAKRAVNKGTKGSRMPRGRNGNTSPSIKRAKRTHVSTPRSRIVSAARGTPELASPAITPSSGTASVCTSPGSYNTLPRAQFSPGSHGSTDGFPALSSTNYITFSNTEFDDLFLSRSFHPVGPGLQYAGSFGEYEFNQSNAAGHDNRVSGVHNIMQSPPRINNKMNTIPEEETNKNHATGDVEMQDQNEYDPFSMHDPLLAIMMKPSEDQPSEVNLANHLDYFHRSVRNMIVKSPAKDQAALVSSFSEWAKHISKDPLESKGLAKRDV